MTLELSAAIFFMVLLTLAWALACLLWAAIRGRRQPLTTFLLGLAIIAVVPVGYLVVNATGTLR